MSGVKQDAAQAVSEHYARPYGTAGGRCKGHFAWRFRLLNTVLLVLTGALAASVGCLTMMRVSQRPLSTHEALSALGHPASTNRAAGVWPLSVSHVPTQHEVCEDYLGVALGGPFGLILTADPGDFSGTPEAHFIIANMKHRVLKPRSETVCGGLYYGRLLGQPALVVTTGIGPTAAGLCTLELLTNCGSLFTEMIYFGTSGWSPQFGGVLDPDNCTKLPDPRRPVTRVGDVCVSPVSVNWVCKKSTWSDQAQGYPNQCFRPTEVTGPNATALFGECQFFSDNLSANLDLADELIAAAASKAGMRNQPMRQAVVQANEERYWRLMSEGTGVSYPPLAPEEPPKVWDYTQCAEVDGQFFFTGVPWEVKARDYAAATISSALAATQSRGGGSALSGAKRSSPVGPTQVLAVSAMEGVGVAEAVEKYNRLDSTARKVPYTNVRTASNWVHHPVSMPRNDGVWGIYREVPEDYVNGYAYAIATGSSAILSLYQRRCIGMDDATRARAEAAAAAAEAAQQGQDQALPLKLQRKEYPWAMVLQAKEERAMWARQQLQQDGQQQQQQQRRRQRQLRGLGGADGLGAAGRSRLGRDGGGDAAAMGGGGGTGSRGQDIPPMCTFLIDY